MGKLKNVSREAQKAAFANMENITKKGIARYQERQEAKAKKKKEESNAEETKAEE